MKNSLFGTPNKNAQGDLGSKSAESAGGGCEQRAELNTPRATRLQWRLRGGTFLLQTHPLEQNLGPAAPEPTSWGALPSKFRAAWWRSMSQKIIFLCKLHKKCYFCANKEFFIWDPK